MTCSSNTHPFDSNFVTSPDVDPKAWTSSSRGSDSVDAQSIDLETSSSRLYHIYHTAIRYDYHVLDTNKKHLYFVYNSHLKPRKADITVHTGEDSKAPVAGVCKFLHLSRHCKVGLGDPQQAGAMVWEDLQCQNLTRTKYRWPMFSQCGRGITVTIQHSQLQAR
ncbi:hypothetical protein BJX76DRAFT_340794 [Aspergillus varians]